LEIGIKQIKNHNKPKLTGFALILQNQIISAQEINNNKPANTHGLRHVVTMSTVRSMCKLAGQKN
jgi:hypothetical protein